MTLAEAKGLLHGMQEVLGTEQIAEYLITSRPARTQLDAVGHRVVRGGDRFHEPARIDEEALSEIQRLGELTPRRKTLTYDRGKEMVEHERLAQRLAIQIFLADP